MARPLRLETPGGVYHLTARGNERKPIYLDAGDRHLFLDLPEESAVMSPSVEGEESAPTQGRRSRVLQSVQSV